MMSLLSVQSRLESLKVLRASFFLAVGSSVIPAKDPSAGCLSLLHKSLFLFNS